MNETPKYAPGIKAVKTFFEMSMEEMKKEWKELSDAGKAELGRLSAEALNAQA